MTKNIFNKMNSFDKVLKRAENEYHNLYSSLPYDIQDIIYKNIRDSLLIKSTMINKKRCCTYLKKNMKPTTLESYGGYSGGAWEFIFVRKNKWLYNSSRINEINEFLYESAINFYRTNMVLY